MNTERWLLLAAAALVLLTFAVAVLVYVMRVREMTAARIHPQAVALHPDRPQRQGVQGMA